MLADLFTMLILGLVAGLSMGYVWGSRHTVRSWREGRDWGVLLGREQATREALQDMLILRDGDKVEIRVLGRN